VKHLVVTLLISLWLGSAITDARADAPHSPQQSAWRDLWLRKDQQAEKLLQENKPTEAAPLLDDPKRRAYAELKAQQYQEAAQRLAPFKDAQSQYNRGNALAHAGDLKNALAAYDAALSQLPSDADARHNRDLVAKALEQQAHNSKQNQSSQKQSNQKNDSDQSKSDSKQNGQSKNDESQSNQSQSNQSQNDQNKNGQNKTNQGDKQNQQAQQPSKNDSADSGKNGAQSASKDHQTESAKENASNSSANDKQNNKAVDKEQAKADAAAALSRNQVPTDPATNRSGGEADSTAAKRAAKSRAKDAQEPSKPQSEQALAMDQWLRRIPDDPSGLLRRKFLIEHMIKQQEEQK
jgi:Ca-activated chloride channel family protein